VREVRRWEGLAATPAFTMRVVALMLIVPGVVIACGKACMWLLSALKTGTPLQNPSLHEMVVAAVCRVMSWRLPAQHPATVVSA
jgi:hypothetical protein